MSGALVLRFPGQYADSETGFFYNYFRTYQPNQGRYTQADPIGLDGGWNRMGYVDQNPLSFKDPYGLVKHVTGQTIQCSKNCTIRIDYVLDEKTGKITKHLHWECKGKSGVGGEHGGTSHGETLGGAPDSVKECARQNGFEPDPLPDPKPATSSICGDNCRRVLVQVMGVAGAIVWTWRTLCGGPY